MQTAPSIFIENAFLNYEGHLVFDNFSCLIPGGKTTCLLGASGVGKTSLLNLIAGISLGKISGRVRSSDHLSLAPRLAYMSQQDNLLPWLSVLDNAVLGFMLRKQPIPREKAKDLLIHLGLGLALKKYPHQLSGGMRQRTALARTFLEDKPVILMDEPFSSLDTITRFELQNLSASLLKNKTLILVTHDPAEALRLGDFIGVLQGSPVVLDQIYIPGNPPRSPTSAAFLKTQAELIKKLAKNNV